MKAVKKGSTSISEYFNLVDKTAGTPKTGVAEDQIYLSYVRTRSTLVASVCATLASGVAAFSQYGAFEVDATNAPGLYRVDVPNGAFATGVDGVILAVFATTTSSVAPALKEVMLVDNIEADTYSLINAGVKASTVVGNVGGSVGSVVGNVGGSVASVVGNVGGTVASVVGNVGGSVASVIGNVGSVSGGVTGSVGSVVGNVGGSVASVLGNVGSVSGGVTGSVGSVVGNVGGSVASVVGGVGGAVAGSVGSVVGNVGGSVGSVVGNVGGSVASVTGNVGSVSGGVSGSVGSVVGNVGGSVASVVGNVGGTVGSVTGGVTVATNNDKTGYVLTAVGSAALTEDYAADGAAGTLNQMLYAILQNLGDFSITGTVRTVNKLDGATAAMQYSLNSTTAPTATTRFL